MIVESVFILFICL